MKEHRFAPMCLAAGLFAALAGCAGDSAKSARAPASGDVQERAVVRDHRTQQPEQTAPATVKPGMGIFQPGMQMTPIPSAPSGGSTGPLPVVGGTFEPDYKYPWVVTSQSKLTCRGVLLEPRWVLTAAHCVQINGATVSYTRTDPNTGAKQTESRTASPGSGVFIHPQYDPTRDHINDIALLKLSQPFTITPYLQTVGLPRDLRRQGVVGTLANFSHSGSPPAGQVAIFRAPLPPYTPTMPPNYPTANDTKIYITAMAANASLCEGDSGSGFVTVEYGRAMVRGVASMGNTSNCMTPNGEAVFTDVFAFRGWIFQTMGMNNATLTGNTRARWSGRAARGRMILACLNPYGNLEGPLNVVGVEEGAVCEANQTQTILCKLDSNQGGPVSMTPVLSGLTVRTTTSGGAPQVQTIPASGNTASFFGLLPPGASREVTCQIGTALTSGTLGTAGTAVLSRGVEQGQSEDTEIEQPSPFDPSEEPNP